MAYKHKSGAQKRKERKERDAKAESAKQEQAKARNELVPGRWGVGYPDPRLSDPNGPPVQLPIYGSPPPTLVPAVNAAITQLEQGQFFAASILWDGMLRDDRIAATFNVRLNGLLGSQLNMRPADEDSEECRTIAEDAEALQSKMMPSHQIKRLIGNGLAMSVGIAQKLTTRTVKSSVPTFEVWHNRWLRFDWGIMKFRLITQNAGEITIEPGDPEWIIYQPFGPQGWLHSAIIRSLALPWLARVWARSWWCRHQEVHGNPLRLGIVPPNRQDADEKKFLRQLSNLGNESVIRLQQGSEENKFDVRLLQAATDSWEGFLKLIEHCDDSIAIAWLGQKQSTTGQSGLGSQEKAGQDTLLRLLRGDAAIAELFRDEIYKPWAADNYGDEEKAPYPEWEIDPPEDENARAKRDLAVAQALVQFKNAGAPLDVRTYMTDLGYPLLSPEEHQAQKEQAIANAQAVIGKDPKDPNNEPDGDEDGKEPPDGDGDEPPQPPGKSDDDEPADDTKKPSKQA